MARRLGTARAAAILVIAAVAFSAPAVEAETDADVERLVTVLAGEYDSAPLVAAARARAVQGARLPRELAEAHYMFATPVDMPRLGRHVVYIEWRHD
ncbi:MAG: hypothetical protein SFV21_07805, partial [Rhodospirillaceae bacterium]|nr:hypothetical protein [Rhodospirillaceae bacterium]